MTDTITLTGLVATEPKHLTTSEGLPITSFRLASTQRRYDRNAQSWVDGETNWYTVTAFRRLAANAANSVAKGQRVVVTGRLRLREWQSGERSGMSVEVEADAVGHDLTWGTAIFSRNSVVASPPENPAGEHAGVSTSEAQQGSESPPVPASAVTDQAGWAVPAASTVPTGGQADADRPF